MLPGTKVLVFDNSLFVDDRSTPSSATWNVATIIRHYGKIIGGWRYPDLVDVRFDHRPDTISKCHITEYAVRRLTEPLERKEK